MDGVPGGDPAAVVGGLGDDLACPACRGDLTPVPGGSAAGSAVRAGDTLRCDACGRRFPVEDGIPDLLLTDELSPAERDLIAQLDALAGRYDRLLPRLYTTLGTRERAVRTELLARLGLRPGGRVLLVGAGTGRDLRHLHRATAPGGAVVGVDRSAAMLRVSRRKTHLQGTPVSLVRAGYRRLPFKDARFDAVLQMGAVDPGDPGPALAELCRVARPGAPCVIMGEGSDPARRHEAHVRHWMAHNPVHARGAPVDALPAGATGLELHWVLQGLFYLMSFRKA